MPEADLNRCAFFPAGKPAPPFELTAIKSGRQVSPKDCNGTILGLIFHGRESAQAVVEVNQTVRPLYPDASQVTLASVVDLRGIPRLLRGMVRPVLEQVYDQASQELPAGLNPADYVFLLPDWKGEVSKAFGVKDADKRAALVVVDGDGRVVGSYQGPEPGKAMLHLVRLASGDSTTA
jgi:hypothetical protein